MTITIKAKTPRLDMYQSVIIGKMGDFYQALAEAEGIPSDIMDIELTKFAIVSTRVDFGGAVSFEAALPTDTPDAIKAKFLTYLDSDHGALVGEAQLAIRDKDAPTNPTTAPDAPADDDSKKNRAACFSG